MAFFTLQTESPAFVGGGDGDDTYLITPFTMAGRVDPITITDTQGNNTIQLASGMEIVSSTVTNNEAQVIIADADGNQYTINISNADAFTWEPGGNFSTGTTGTVQTYDEFVTTTLGIAGGPPAAGDPAETGGDVVIGGGGGGGGDTFTLTTGTDIFNGTVDNDTFTGDPGTLQTADVMVDPSTTDQDNLNLTVASYAAGVTPTVANIENINVTGEFGSTGLALTNVSNAEVLTLDAGIPTGIGTVISATSTSVGSIVAGSNIQTLNVTSLAAGTSGNIDVDAGTSAATVVLTGNNGNDTYTLDAMANSTALTIATAGTGTDTYTLNLNGSTQAGTALTVSNGDIEALNLNAETGSIILNLQNTNQLVNAVSGTVTLTGDQDITIVGDADVLSGNAVTNNVRVVDQNTASTTFAITDQTTAANLFLNRADFDIIDVRDTAIATGTTFNTASTINLGVTLAGGVTFNVDNSAGTLASSGQTGALNLDINANQTSTITTGAQVSTLVLNNTGTSGRTMTVVNTQAGGVDTVSVTGTQDLSFTGGWQNNNTETMSAAGFTGNLTLASISNTGTVVGGEGDDSLTVGAAVAATFLGGAGVDTLLGNTQVDTFNGQDGNDNLNGGAGSDVLTGGSGNDVFVFNTGTANESGDPSATPPTFDTITDFTSGSDIIDNVPAAITIVSGSAASVGTAAISATGLATFNVADDTFAERVVATEAGIDASGGAADGQAAVFEFDGNAYVFISEGTDGLSNDDVLIQLTGINPTTGLTLVGGDITAVA